MKVRNDLQQITWWKRGGPTTICLNGMSYGKYEHHLSSTAFSVIVAKTNTTGGENADVLIGV